MEQFESQDQHELTRYEGGVETENTLRLRLDPAQALAEIRANLLNQTWDEKEAKWVDIPELKPVMKKAGIEELMSLLRQRMSIDKVLGNLKEAEINNIVRDCGEIVLHFLFFKSKVYNLDDSDWDKIEKMIRHNIKIFLSRAKDGTENKIVSKSMEYREVATRKSTDYQADQPQQEKPKTPGFGMFGGRR